MTLRGELSPAELELESGDALVQFAGPVTYDLAAERSGAAVLVRGQLGVVLACTCVRCLKPFERAAGLSEWSCELFPGDEETPVSNDCLDLTLRVREDILLAIPQHPLCEPECRGLPSAPPSQAPEPGDDRRQDGGAAVWSELNKLKW